MNALMSERRPRMQPSPPLLQRKCDCGGACTSCATAEPKLSRFAADLTRVPACSAGSTCAFYTCREKQHACGADGYYLGYGKKYCEIFSKTTRPQLSKPGQKWLDCTLKCLQTHLEKKVPENTPCPVAKKSAFDSHPLCYAACGVCDLSLGDQMAILRTPALEDFDVEQFVATLAMCGILKGGLLPMPWSGGVEK